MKERILMEVRADVEKIVCEILDREVEISDDANLMYDFNMDSIQIMNVVVRLEDQFDIEFEYEDLNIDNLIIFSKLVGMVERLVE